MIPSTAGRPRAGLLLVLLYTLPVVAAALIGLPSSAGRTDGGPIVPTVLTEQGAGPGGSAGDGDSALAVLASSPEAADETAVVAARGGVTVTASTSFYGVEGSDVRSLLVSLRQRGPRDSHGAWAASTAWMFRWSYQPVANAGCRVASAHVELDLTYTYPQWTSPSDAPPAVVAAWDRYLARIELHEHGHREIAEAAANDLARAIDALPAEGSCDRLATAARATAGQILARHAQAQIDYDRETGHCATQGAILTSSQ
jgi:predicted secreted Zn-dependent protease